MSIDPEIAVGASLGAREFEWSASDVILYHLALGATELKYAFEPRLTVLPTFGIVAPTFHATEPPAVVFPGIDIDLADTLHGSQQITVHSPLRASGKARATGRIADVCDKGSAAVIVTEHEVADLDGTPLYTMRSEIFARAGFPRPILHGLCTYGMVHKSIVDQLGLAIPHYQAQFAGIVFPGDTLRTRLWEGAFATYVDDRLVLAGAYTCA